MCSALWSDLYGATRRSLLSCQLIVLTTQGEGCSSPGRMVNPYSGSSSLATVRPSGTTAEDICCDLGLRLLH